MGASELAQRIAIWALVLSIVLLPGVAIAQSGLDPAVRSVVGRGVSQTAPMAVGAAAVAVATQPDVPFALPTPTPAPVLFPTPTPAPSLDPGEPRAASAAGVTVQTPGDWDLFAEEAGGEPYIEFAPPLGELEAVLLGGGADFPGVLGVVIFRAMADALVGSFMEDTEILSVEQFFTDQGVPAVGILFAGEMDGAAATGAIVVYAPGDNAYLMLAFGPTADWDRYGADIEEIAETIAFAPELVTLFTATQDTYFADRDEVLETIVFTDWHALAYDDDKMPIVVVEPDFAYVVALGLSASFSDQLADGEDVLRLLVQATADTELSQEIIAEIMDALGGMGSDITIDESLTTIYATDEGGIIRVIGTGALDEETVIPIGVYLDLRPSGSITMIVMGNVDLALADEDLLLEILAETLVLE